MKSPTDRPNFLKIASKLQKGDILEIANQLSIMYDHGYHVGNIYGWGIQMDKEVAEHHLHDPVEDLMNYGGSGDNED